MCRFVLIVILVSSVVGCSTTIGHKEFYTQRAPSKYPVTNQVNVWDYGSADINKVYDLFFSDFLIIGKSSFNGGMKTR